jgi:hypothetical protein
VGPIKWSTTCEIVTADPGREFAFTVLSDKNDRESTRWRYRLSPSGLGTNLSESFEFVWCPVPSRIGELFLPRGRVLRQGLNRTLVQIKAVAEASLLASMGDIGSATI